MNAPEHASNALSAAPETSRPCDECGRPYEARRRWSRFCGTPCRNEWHRKKAIGPEGRVAELERRVAALEARVKVLDEPVQ